jgi:F420H(2)-dependent biliverdin reductase
MEGLASRPTMARMNPLRLFRPQPSATDARAGVTVTVTPAPHVAEMLSTSRVAWLSTVDADGAPALVPTWFWWDGEVFWLFAKPGQRKLRNIRRFERVTLAVGNPAADFDVQLVEGVARAVPAATSTVMPAGMKRAYDGWLTAAGLDWDRYCATYRQPIVVRPTRFLPWRGLTHATPAAAPSPPSAAGAVAFAASATLA